MADQVVIQYRFTDPATGFSDAIVLPLDEFRFQFGPIEDPIMEELEATKAARVTNWQTALDEAKNAPPPDPKEEAQDLADQVAALAAHLATLEADLAVKVDALPVKDRPVVDAVDVVAVVEGK